MIFAEKGIVDYFNGGNALNSVPDECKIKFSAEKEILDHIKMMNI